MRWFIGVSVLTLIGCTYSVIMNHTEGTASDMVDENQSASPDIKADLTLPKMPTPAFGVDSRNGQRV